MLLLLFLLSPGWHHLGVCNDLAQGHLRIFCLYQKYKTMYMIDVRDNGGFAFIVGNDVICFQSNTRIPKDLNAYKNAPSLSVCVWASWVELMVCVPAGD